LDVTFFQDLQNWLFIGNEKRGSLATRFSFYKNWGIIG